MNSQSLFGISPISSSDHINLDPDLGKMPGMPGMPGIQGQRQDQRPQRQVQMPAHMPGQRPTVGGGDEVRGTRDYSDKGNGNGNEHEIENEQQNENENENDDEDEEVSTPSSAVGKRRKAPLKYIENTTRRHVTFAKRRHGIMKKAYELAVMTGANVLLLILSPKGLVYTFATPSLQPLIRDDPGKELIRRCLNQDNST